MSFQFGIGGLSNKQVTKYPKPKGLYADGHFILEAKSLPDNWGGTWPDSTSNGNDHVEGDNYGGISIEKDSEGFTYLHLDDANIENLLLHQDFGNDCLKYIVCSIPTDENTQMMYTLDSFGEYVIEQIGTDPGPYYIRVYDADQNTFTTSLDRSDYGKNKILLACQWIETGEIIVRCNGNEILSISGASNVRTDDRSRINDADSSATRPQTNVYEAGLFDRDIRGAELESLEKYLITKYNLDESIGA